MYMHVVAIFNHSMCKFAYFMWKAVRGGYSTCMKKKVLRKPITVKGEMYAVHVHVSHTRTPT